MDLYRKYVLEICTLVLLFLSSLKTYGNCSLYEESTCIGYTFSPDCGPNAVILMKKALFGRMKEGTCGTVNLGYLGCSKNVLSVLESECSGRKSCSMIVRDDKFRTEACTQLTSYLETQYICQEIIKTSVTNCQSCPGIEVITPSGFFSSEIASTTNCGSTHCPWMIIAEKSQTISFTLIDFSNDTAIDNLKECKQYGMITEYENEKSFKICSLKSKESQVYVSESNKVTLQLLHEGRTPFLIKYEFLGCKDIMREDVVFLRQENRAQMKCRNSNEKFIVECIKSKWQDLDKVICSDIQKSKDYDPSLISRNLWIVLLSSICFMLGSFCLIIGLWRYCRPTDLTNDRLYNPNIQENIYNEPKIYDEPKIYNEQKLLKEQKIYNERKIYNEDYSSPPHYDIMRIYDQRHENYNLHSRSNNYQEVY